jgi:hypothetical protein
LLISVCCVSVETRWSGLETTRAVRVFGGMWEEGCRGESDWVSDARSEDPGISDVCGPEFEGISVEANVLVVFDWEGWVSLKGRGGGFC